jgi:CPA1 family monovalent cation:H+ antiporter
MTSNKKQLTSNLALTTLIVFAIMALTACSSVDNQGNGSQLNNDINQPTIDTIQQNYQSEELINEEDELNERFFVIEEIIIGLLFIATLVGIIAQRLRVPYTVGLVIMGLALTFFSQMDVTITPNLILAVLVPPLIFEAAFHINYSDLRRNLATILAFAVPGVLVTTLLVGFIISKGVGIPIYLALIFGTVISATDPISVVALFRRMGVPRRLQLLLEGESLFNDGTAIVIFHLVIAITMAGIETFNIIDSIFDFIYVSGGGLIIGILLGSLISQVITRVDDHLIETTLTSVLAYGAYLIAEVIGVSGVLAVVAAGLVNGNVGPRGMSPTTRIVVYNFWEYAAFLANSFVFLLIGLQIDLDILVINWKAIAWGIAGVLIARAVVVYSLSWAGRKIKMKWRHVLFWGGLRGAISLALALSLPIELGPARTQIQSMVFGVVLFSLIIQGFSMSTLVRRLGLVHRDELKIEYERRHARAVASQSAYEHLHRMNQQGLISAHTWQKLSNPLKEHNLAMIETVYEAMSAYPELEAEELETAQHEYLRAQRSTLSSLLTSGVISEETYTQLTNEVDAGLTDSQLTWPELFVNKASRRKTINRLVTAVIQEQDVESAVSSLLKLGFSVTHLPSSGGFLGKRSTTLMIGLAEGMEEAMTRALYQSCRTRVEYITLPIEGSPMPLPTPTPITVGGATIFSFEVERYEEI